MKYSRGLTMIELMVTLAIASIVLGMAAPSMRNMLQNNRITAQANELVATMGLARSEAIKRGVPVAVCRSTNFFSCLNSAGSWATGWIVFDDPDNDAIVDSGETIIKVASALAGNPTLTGPAPVVYQATGLVNAAAVFTHTISGCSGNQQRTININATGRVMVTKGAC